MYKTPEYDSKKVYENAPDMWISELEAIEKLLIEQSKDKKKISVLEWGSGNSSVFFPKYLEEQGIEYEWHCMENFIPWHDKVNDMIEASGLQGKVTCHLKSATDEPDKDIQEKMDATEFLEFPLSMGKKFDFILIDARKRKECLKLAPKAIAENGVVVLHDAERVRYHEGFELYRGGGNFIVENKSPNVPGGVQKLWVGFPLDTK